MMGHQTSAFGRWTTEEENYQQSVLKMTHIL